MRQSILKFPSSAQRRYSKVSSPAAFRPTVSRCWQRVNRSCLSPPMRASPSLRTGGSRSPGGDSAMRIATRVCVAAMAVAALNLSASAAEVLSPAAPAPADEKGSAQAQVWFERALSLDIGAEGAPDAVQAFAAMRRAAESGHTQAEFNVAAMLDSGRGRQPPGRLQPRAAL